MGKEGRKEGWVGWKVGQKEEGREKVPRKGVKEGCQGRVSKEGYQGKGTKEGRKTRKEERGGKEARSEKNKDRRWKGGRTGVR